MREISGQLDGRGKRFAVVASRFNGRLVEGLVNGALDCLTRHGVATGDVTLVRVPGAWELPLAAEALAAGGGCDGVVALAVVVRGETAHFDHLCAACFSGLERVAASHRLPVGLGVLTCDTEEQAASRSGGKGGNKGWDAALSVLEMAAVLADLGHDLG